LASAAVVGSGSSCNSSSQLAAAAASVAATEEQRRRRRNLETVAGQWHRSAKFSTTGTTLACPPLPVVVNTLRVRVRVSN